MLETVGGKQVGKCTWNSAQREMESYWRCCKWCRYSYEILKGGLFSAMVCSPETLYLIQLEVKNFDAGERLVGGEAIVVGERKGK